uniref:Cathepsin L1-like n=1 Tax=Sus scrofa TaxID=9823 RepID=A0A8D0ZEI0_PIG
MNPSLLLAAFCLGIASAAPRHDHSLDADWYKWKATHRKLYGLNEEGRRRAVWEKNMKMIERHNWEHRQGKHSFTMAMNAFGDMTNEEFRKTMNGFQNQKHKKGKVFLDAGSALTPHSVDWREKGYVTAVKNQGHCGSCWAFSATGALEGQMFRKTGKLVSLSEQNLVDCSRPQGNQGCNGGLMDNAFQYIKDNGGLDSEESYPYFGKVNGAPYLVVKVEHFWGWGNRYHVKNSHFRLWNLYLRTIRTAIKMCSPWSSCRGIYFEPQCSSEDLDHGVLVVGYGVEGAHSNNKYWLVKNSWGNTWGMDGYIKMTKDQNNHCGIATMASYPVV